LPANLAALVAPGAANQLVGMNAGGTATEYKTAGTGISVGAGTISNSGVTSITGTANQITASASTGAVTLSVPETSVRLAQRTITSAEILSLNSNPIELVPAPGAGKAIFPILAVAKQSTGNGYSGVTSLSLVWSGTTTAALVFNLGVLSGYGGAGPQLTSATGAANYRYRTYSNGTNGPTENLGLNIRTGADPTGGTADLDVSVWYVVI